MKRKIAAIFASDIAQYSRLVSEDEEETVRRLTSLRKVVEDFITRDSGRVFSLAGDAIYAEFPSAVDAVRCAIDIQESLRTRNLAYPQSRHMNLRIGITIGDVVDRDGALMGDGVNIAARLEGISDVGGICVSRGVYEQVANKLSVAFSDIGEQQVKNIPTPVHAFMVQMRPGDKPVGPPPVQKGPPPPPARSLSPAAIIVASVSALGIAALAYLAVTAYSGKETTAGNETSPTTTVNAPTTTRVENEPLVPETVPFIRDSDRVVVREVYFPAPDFKALAINYNRIGMSTGQRDVEAAKAAALDACTRAGNSRAPCELYAVGNVVVSRRGRIPMPPEPWVIRDASIEKPFVNTDIPFGPDSARRLGLEYLKARTPKALALSPIGAHNYYAGVASADEAVRRSLERCGSNSGTACLIAAIDDVIVIPIPKTMKPVGLFRTAPVATIAPELRDDVTRRLANSTKGWNAVAAGANGRVGLALAATSEKEAIDTATANCTRQDRDCRVVVIGPFVVERLSTTSTETTPSPPPTPPQNPGPPSPTTTTADQTALGAALASASAELTTAARDSLVRRYEGSKVHRALALVPGTSRVWRSFGMASANNARNKVLEGCEVMYEQPCALIAVDDEVQAPVDGKWSTRNMERVRYAGTYDPQRIPGLSLSVRRRADITAYANAAAPKAVAYHPTGAVFITAAAASQHEAEQQALSACNDDPVRHGRFGPCFLYAVGNDVVLPQRHTKPVTP